MIKHNIYPTETPDDSFFVPFIDILLNNVNENEDFDLSNEIKKMLISNENRNRLIEHSEKFKTILFNLDIITKGYFGYDSKLTNFGRECKALGGYSLSKFVAHERKQNNRSIKQKPLIDNKLNNQILFPINNLNMKDPLKSLYVNLKRLKICNYLVSEVFHLIIMELNQDAIYGKYLNQAEFLDIPHWSNVERCDYEEALFLWMKYVYKKNPEEFPSIFLPIILSFVEWSEPKSDFSKVLVCLKLIINEIDYLNFEIEFKEIQKNKNMELFKNRENLNPKLISNNNQSKMLEIENNTQLSYLPNKKVFIVHGWDELSLLELEKFLRNDLALEPIIMKDLPNQSIEIIFSKFEKLASECVASIILMTPDDTTEENKKRARQNVVFELGWFLGYFLNKNPRKVIILKKDDTEMFSDIQGVIYLPFKDKIKDTFYDLQKQIKLWNL